MTDPVRRRPDWRARLSAHIDAVRGVPFDEAAHHCGLFAADAVAAMTGLDLAAAYRDCSMRAGLRRLKRAGHADHVAYAAAHLPAIAPHLARIGDLAVFATDDGVGHGFGVVVGERAFVMTPEGLGTIPVLPDPIAGTPGAVGAFMVG